MQSRSITDAIAAADHAKQSCVAVKYSKNTSGCANAGYREYAHVALPRAAAA